MPVRVRFPSEAQQIPLGDISERDFFVSQDTSVIFQRYFDRAVINHVFIAGAQEADDYHN